MGKITPGFDQVEDFLGQRYPDVAHIVLLNGGDWSSAFGFVSGARHLVLRLGQHREDYEKDRFAATWSGPGLPIPAVLEIGDAFDGSYAISVRHFGRTFDEMAPMAGRAVLEQIFGALDRIRAIELPGTGFGMWDAPTADAGRASWPEYLYASIADRGEERLRDWQQRLADHRGAQSVLNRGIRVLERLAPLCPNERHVIHNDLLLNILFADDCSVTAVFDWGNSLAGDPLYDIAWLLYLAPAVEGFRTADIDRKVRERFDEPDVGSRLECYQLHIALDEMQYLAYEGRSAELEAVVQRTSTRLTRLESAS